MYTLDLENIDLYTLQNTAKMAFDYKIKYTKIDENIYELDYGEMLDYNYSYRSIIIIPKILYYNGYSFKLNIQKDILISNNVYNELDDFIKDWIDDKNKTKIPIYTQLSFHKGNNNILYQKLELFKELNKLCLDNKELLSFMNLVFDFYKEDLAYQLKLKDINTNFLKKINLNNYTFEELIHKFNLNEEPIIFDNTSTNIKSANNMYLTFIKFNRQKIFSTFEFDFYKNHRGLQFLKFIENF